MIIKINDIPPEGLTVEVDQNLDLFGGGSASTAAQAVLTIKSVGGGVLHITGRIQATPMLECSRCLKQFPFPVDTEIAFDLAPLSSLGPAPEHELGKGELDMEFYQNDEIEPVELVREQLFITLPMVPLHRPDCKGLCSVCGADMNEAKCGCPKDSSGGAFSVLKDLLQK